MECFLSLMRPLLRVMTTVRLIFISPRRLSRFYTHSHPEAGPESKVPRPLQVLVMTADSRTCPCKHSSSVTTVLAQAQHMRRALPHKVSHAPHAIRVGLEAQLLVEAHDCNRSHQQPLQSCIHNLDTAQHGVQACRDKPHLLCQQRGRCCQSALLSVPPPSLPPCTVQCPCPVKHVV